MADFKKQITRDEYLRAFALFVMAHDHYVRSGEFNLALNKVLMVEPEQYSGGHVDDTIFNSERVTAADFDDALKRDGIEVVDDETEAA